MIETSLYISIEYKFCFGLDLVKDSRYCILAGAPWSEAIAVFLENRFPFRFDCHLYYCLLTSFKHGRDTQWPPFCFPWFWYPDTSNWFRFLMFPVLWMDLFCQNESIFGGDGFHAIYPGGFLALVFLSHSSHRDKPSRFGFHQELFELLNTSLFAMLSGSVDA